VAASHQGQQLTARIRASARCLQLLRRWLALSVSLSSIRAADGTGIGRLRGVDDRSRELPIPRGAGRTPSWRSYRATINMGALADRDCACRRCRGSWTLYRYCGGVGFGARRIGVECGCVASRPRD
jgi:hypothetical protein